MATIKGARQASGQTTIGLRAPWRFRPRCRQRATHCFSMSHRLGARSACATNQKKERRLLNGFQPFVRLRSSEGNVYSAAKAFLREVEALKREHLSRREPRKMARPRDNDFGQSLPSTHIHRRFWGMIGSIPSAQATSCEVGTVWVRTMALPERPAHAQIGVRNCLGAPSDPARAPSRLHVFR